MKQFNTTPLENLPAAEQQRIKDTLRAYSSVDVWYENGRYTFTATLRAQQAPDFKYIGRYRAEDVYTEEERILNYVNGNYCFPIYYKGNRDYSIFHTGKRETFKMVNGNIEIA